MKLKIQGTAKIVFCCKCGKEIYMSEDDVNIENAQRAYQEKVEKGYENC